MPRPKTNKSKNVSVNLNIDIADIVRVKGTKDAKDIINTVMKHMKVETVTVKTVT